MTRGSGNGAGDGPLLAEVQPPDGAVDSGPDSADGRRRAGFVGLAMVVVSAVACVPLLSGWDLRAMTDVGLASVFPPGFWIALLVLVLGTALCVLSRRWVFVAVALVVTVFLLPGLAVLVEPNLRFDVAWRHLGLIAEIGTSRRIDPHIDAYFSWPGFFALFAFLQQALGIGSLYPLARIAPLLYNLAYLVPLYRIGLTMTRSRLVTWVGMWLFSLFNWIGQDYFSPQGLYFLFYLVIIAVACSYFERSARLDLVVPRLLPARLRSSRDRIPPRDLAVGPDDARTRVGFVLVIILLAAAIVPSHQLTPFALIAAFVVLALCGLTRLWRTALLIALMTFGWLAFGAVTYVQGHVSQVFGDLGRVGVTLGQSVGGRVSGSAGHQLVVRLRLASEILLWGTAAIGLLRRVRAGASWAWVTVLAIVPFLLLGTQSYGGEILLRCALFASPFMALLAAQAFVTAGDRVSRRGAVGLVALAVLAAALFPFVRWGNEKADWYSDQEVQGVQQMYSAAPRGSVLVGITGSMPWRAQDYAGDHYRTLGGKDPADVARGRIAGPDQFVDLDSRDPALLVSQIRSRMEPRGGECAFLLATRAQAASMQLTGPFGPGAFQNVVDTMRASSVFRELYSNRDAALFSLGTCARQGGR